ncbi:MAG: glycoside hydrolase family 5 protein [Hyphomonadaceae bacterium]
MNRREILLGGAALAACSREAESQAPPAPFAMRRGVNLGNALEAPKEGDWGYRIEPAHLIAISNAGFDGIRVPIRWDLHADADGNVRPDFLIRVAAIVDQGLALDLKVQLDCHHYEGLIVNPNAERARFLNIWRSIAEDLQDAPPNLIFEPLNEPNGARWTGAFLRTLQRDVIEVIREHNPNRLIVLGPSQWQNIDALHDWRPPEDRNIAVSVHYYEPHAFTHQNAPWMANAPNFGREWGTNADHDRVRQQVRAAASWAQTQGYPMQLGEFGVNRAVPIQQRAAWTRTVREACEANGMAWCAWDFAGAFPVWDRERREMIPQMQEALFGVVEDRLGER